MPELTAEAVRSFVLRLVKGPLESQGLTPDDVPDDYDLLSGGLIDSFGLLETITAVEEEFGIELDFEQMDADHIGVVRAFSRFVAETGARVRS